jgi:hypothetical protein
MSENCMTAGDLFDEMNEDGVTVIGGNLILPDGHELGIRLIPEVIRAGRMQGEPDWD